MLEGPLQVEQQAREDAEALIRQTLEVLCLGLAPCPLSPRLLAPVMLSSIFIWTLN